MYHIYWSHVSVLFLSEPKLIRPYYYYESTLLQCRLIMVFII